MPRDAPTVDPFVMRYRSYFENAVVGMCRRDLDGHFIEANPALLEMLKLDTLSELHEREAEIADSADVRLRLRGHIERENRIVGMETRWLTARLDPISVRISAVRPMDGRRRAPYYEATVEDISERKRREDALRKAAKSAEASERANSVFLANMSHEVRTPLTSIIGFGSILTRQLSGERQRHAELIVQSGRRLVDTMDAVLTYASLESNGRALQIVEVAVAGLVRSIVNGFVLRATSKEVGLEFTNRERDEMVALADVDALTNIVRNLVDNAVKFTEEGRIDVTLSRSGTDAVVEISDTGTGISSEFLPHVFEPFRQESTGPARSHGGSGIGLTVAKRLAQLMDARIEVESVKGRGSSFSLKMPLVAASAATMAQGTAPNAHG